jgi:hypothetical protein
MFRRREAERGTAVESRLTTHQLSHHLGGGFALRVDDGARHAEETSLSESDFDAWRFRSDARLDA